MRETVPDDEPITTPTGPFEALPYSRRCREIWQRGEHLLIGVSPGNSYFSHRRITELIGWGLEFFERVDIVYADLHVATQYETFGYTPEHAQRRAAKEVKATARRIERGVEGAGRRSGVGVHALSEFTAADAYRRLHRRAVDGLRTDPAYRAAAEGMARGFLAARLDEGLAPNEPQLAAGLRYITAELPFFLDTPALLGVASSVSCYHLQLPLTPVLFGRDEGIRAEAGQAYAVIRPAGGPAVPTDVLAVPADVLAVPAAVVAEPVVAAPVAAAPVGVGPVRAA
ncbi:cyclo(L-tyrosyl-L-tyrosyl) synthase [Kitasatospora xanthocidica]|uniref:tRNA-dependent cyclodipeptide synthase n=1 Tax=Kitasatospora xanthocidica TaxID=83382 RepID=UPI0016750D30|nr:tRNA-dependent cyclodipeptide synthase [Kitasatospora xanthocidica]GHF33879.1 cyclo(L-tyrosyl-L-tyrosyl) synthase [Kitasatospora xanthocidica]